MLGILVIDFAVAEVVSICLIVLVIAEGKRNGMPFFDFYWLGMLWYMATFASTIRLISELNVWVTIAGIAPIVTLIAFTIIVYMIEKCNCRGSYESINQS
jgi:hypothetical protein